MCDCEDMYDDDDVTAIVAAEIRERHDPSAIRWLANRGSVPEMQERILECVELLDTLAKTSPTARWLVESALADSTLLGGEK